MPQAPHTRAGRAHLPLALAGAALLLPACGGSDQPGSADLVSGTFVGAVPQTRLYVAVVAAEPQDGQTARPIRVYVCDGRTVNEWFPGRGGNRMAVDAESGTSHVRASLQRAAASGTITLPDGRSVRFRALPASGIAGLYDSMLLPDGTVRGSSETGVRLEGRRVTARPDGRGRFKAVGRYVQPDGTATPWVTFTHARLVKDRAIASRIIVLPDGSRRGGYKRLFRPVFGGNSQPQ